MIRIALISVIGLFLSSCFTYKDVEFNGIEKFKVDEFNKEKVTVSFKANIYNPNNYNIKVKSDQVDVLLSDKVIGQAKIKDKVVLKKETTDLYDVVIESDLKKIAGGSIFGLIDVLSGQSLTLRFRGNIKVRARGLGKKIAFDEEKSFDPSQLNLNLPF